MLSGALHSCTCQCGSLNEDYPPNYDILLSSTILYFIYQHLLFNTDGDQQHRQVMPPVRLIYSAAALVLIYLKPPCCLWKTRNQLAEKPLNISLRYISTLQCHQSIQSVAQPRHDQTNTGIAPIIIQPLVDWSHKKGTIARPLKVIFLINYIIHHFHIPVVSILVLK